MVFSKFNKDDFESIVILSSLLTSAELCRSSKPQEKEVVVVVGFDTFKLFLGNTTLTKCMEQVFNQVNHAFCMVYLY